jgi:HEAT repeat protein
MAVPHLVEALKDEEPEVRTSAAAALGAIGPDASSALPTLRRLLQDANQRVSQAAAEALKRIEPHDTSPSRTGLDDLGDRR